MNKAAKLAGDDPDYSIKDLFEAIAQGNFVSSLKITLQLDSLGTFQLPNSKGFERVVYDAFL